MLQEITGDLLTLRLFSNDVTPADTDIRATYTEVTGGGYTAQSLASGSWTTNITANPAIITYTDFVNFIFTGATTAPNVYGYFITSNLSGEIVLAQRFTSTVIPIANSYIKIKPRLTLDNA